MCKFENCKKRAYFSSKIGEPPKFCGNHRLQGMVNVLEKRRCADPNCDKLNPSFNKPEEKKGLYCKDHKKVDMVNVKHKRCADPNCEYRPSFNKPEETTGLYCAKHKGVDMVNVLEKRRCADPNCDKLNPSFNKPGGKALYCAKHKEKNMVNVVSKRCVEPGCDTIPNFNIPGEKKGLYCKDHKKVDMVNVVSKKCKEPDCDKQPSYGKEGDSTEYCVKHKEVGMVDVLNIKCKEPGCDTIPIFNYKNEKYGLYCAEHKGFWMVNVVHKMCIGCGLTLAHYDEYYKGKCVGCFEGSSKTRKEQEINQMFLDAGLSFTNNKQFPNTCNFKYRPDFFFDCNYYYLIVEVDEDGHRTYDGDCEIARTNNIVGGLDLPVKMIRYNPDNKKFTKEHKQKVLMDTVNEYLHKEDSNIEIIKLFFEDVLEVVC